MDQIELGPVEKLRVTILMDNVTDPLIPDSGPVSRLSWPKALAESAAHVPVWFAADPGVPDALIPRPASPHSCESRRWTRAHAALRHRCLPDRHGRERAPARTLTSGRRGDRAQPRPLGSRHRHGGRGANARATRATCADSPGILEAAPDPLPRARPCRASLDESVRARRSRLPDRRGASALLPARRLGADHPRGRPNNGVRDGLPRAPRARRSSAPQPSPEKQAGVGGFGQHVQESTRTQAADALQETDVELAPDDRCDAKDGYGLLRKASDMAPDQRADFLGDAEQRVPHGLLGVLEELVRRAEQHDLAEEERVPSADRVEPGRDRARRPGADDGREVRLNLGEAQARSEIRLAIRTSSANSSADSCTRRSPSR
jgi:hypothetical protein